MRSRVVKASPTSRLRLLCISGPIPSDCWFAYAYAWDKMEVRSSTGGSPFPSPGPRLHQLPPPLITPTTSTRPTPAITAIRIRLTNRRSDPVQREVDDGTTIFTMSSTVDITSPTHFNQVLHSSRIVVADFWAAWCGPCKAIAPIYEQLSTQLSRPGAITFVKVDTDRQREIARFCEITAMPTFVVYKGGRETKRIKGANPQQLDKAIKELAREAANAEAGGGEGTQGVEGAGSTGWSAFAAPRGYGDVADQVDVKGLDFLNVDGERGENKCLFAAGKPSALEGKKADAATDWIESDTDEQLMLFVPFQAALKLHTMDITSLPPSDDDAIMRPETLQLYTNRSTVLGFDEAEDTPATQTIHLQDSDWDAKTGTARVELRFVKFQNITSLVVFVAEGEGQGDKTRLDRIRLFGETGEKRAMGKLEKVGEE